MGATIADVAYIEMAAWTDPTLTTIRQPTDALGQWAVDRLTRVRRRQMVMVRPLGEPFVG